MAGTYRRRARARDRIAATAAIRVFGQVGIIGKRGEKREEKLHYDEHRLLRDLTSASRIVNAKREGENEGENVSE